MGVTMRRARGLQTSAPAMGSPATCNASPRLAFLFLCENGIATEPLWRDFFEAAGDWRSLASVYVHVADRRFARLPATSFFAGHEIDERIGVNWGDATIMRATVALLRAALKAPCNARFALLSDSCAPLHSLRCMHAFLMRVRRSFVDSAPSTKRRSKYACLGGLSNGQVWRSGSNWVVLTREVAARTVATLGRWRDRRCPMPHLDEHLVQNLGLRIGGHAGGAAAKKPSLDPFAVSLTHFELGAKSTFVTYKRQRHFAHWHAATANLTALASHPTLRAGCTFRPGPKYFARQYDGPDACVRSANASSGPCYLFVRKVPSFNVEPFRTALLRHAASRRTAPVRQQQQQCQGY